MIRVITVLLILCLPGLAQTRNTQEEFLRAVRNLKSRLADGIPIDPVLRIQEDLGLSPEAAGALIYSTNAYWAGLPGFSSSLERLILERRMQVMAGAKVTLPSEAELVAENARKVETFRGVIMSELKDRIGNEAFEHLVRYMSIRQGDFFPMRNRETVEAARVN